MATKKVVLGAKTVAPEGTTSTVVEILEKQEIGSTTSTTVVEVVDPITAETYVAAKEQAALLNGETIKLIDKQIDKLSVVVTEGVFDTSKFAVEFGKDIHFWSKKLGVLPQIPDEIKKLEVEKTAARVETKSAKFVELFVGAIERPDEIRAKIVELSAGLQNPDMSADEKQEFETEKQQLEKELSEFVLDAEQIECIKQFEKQFEMFKIEQRSRMLSNVFKTGSIGLNIGGVPRGTSQRKSTEGEVVKQSNYCSFYKPSSGEVHLQAGDGDLRDKLITMVGNPSWVTPTIKTSGGIPHCRAAVAAGAKNFWFAMVPKEIGTDRESVKQWFNNPTNFDKITKA